MLADELGLPLFVESKGSAPFCTSASVSWPRCAVRWRARVGEPSHKDSVGEHWLNVCWRHVGRRARGSGAARAGRSFAAEAGSFT